MAKILVTGGSGFIAAHVINLLLSAGHTVFTTARSESKAAQVRSTHSSHPSFSSLTVLVAPDAVHPDAYGPILAGLASSRIDFVLHLASPIDFGWTDPQTQAVDAAVNGTKGILAAVRDHAPTVRRVIITSSFATMTDETRLMDPTFLMSEASWNPGTADINVYDGFAYLVSKVRAERAAWAFVEQHKPKFDLVVMHPATVWGPPFRRIGDLDELNYSNGWVRGLLRGEWKNEIPASIPTLEWIDVRDCAEAHLRAMEIPDAPAGTRRRLLVVAGRAGYRDIATCAREGLPELGHIIPGAEVKGGELLPENQRYRYSNEETAKILPMKFMSLQKCVVDTINATKHCVV